MEYEDIITLLDIPTISEMDKQFIQAGADLLELHCMELVGTR